MKLDIEKLASELAGLKGQLYDDALYEVALMEIKLEVTDQITMARALSKAEGDKSKAVLHYPELRVAKLKAEIDAVGGRGPTAGLKKIIKTITSDSVMDFFREVANPQKAASAKRERSEKAHSSFTDEFLKDKYKE